MKKRLKPIPAFKSEAGGRRFWETHDTPQYLDGSKARCVSLPNLKLSTTSISLRLPIGRLDRIKIIAHSRDIPYQSLIETWLAERVERP